MTVEQSEDPGPTPRLTRKMVILEQSNPTLYAELFQTKDEK